MKNLLAENMLRFGTKNLSKSQKSKLLEGALLGSYNHLASVISRNSNGHYPNGRDINADNPNGKFFLEKTVDDKYRLYIQSLQGNKIVNANEPNAMYIVHVDGAIGAALGPEDDPEAFYYGGGNMRSDQKIGSNVDQAAKWWIKNQYSKMARKFPKADIDKQLNVQ